MLVVWVVMRSPAVSWVAWILASLAIPLSLISWLFPSTGLSVWGALMEAALHFYGAGSLIAYMMGDDRVTLDELFAAGATFTLLAWGFAYLYLGCQAWVPGAFAGGMHPDGPHSFIELMFLSFANLSATGLSDIVPTTPTARVLVMLEQFAGIAYLAVVVSRLIGLTVTRQQGKGTTQP